MDYTGPDAADFADVAALNHAFVVRLRAPGVDGERLREQLPEPLHAVVSALRDVQVERLASSPFLLLSLRERASGYWQRLAGEQGDGDLFAEQHASPDVIAAAALSFLWHLARRNPYAARLLAGATNDWCSMLAGNTLLRLLRQASSRVDLLQPRLAGNPAFWTRLLGPGLDSNAEVRGAAHAACLQTILTDVPDPARQLRAAARRTRLPRYRAGPARPPT
jgi:hypothetical protein